MMHATIVLSLSEHGTGLPWQVLFERGGWSEPDGTPAPVVVVPSFALLAVSKSRSKIGWHEFKDAAEHFNIRDEDGLAENILFSSRMESLPSSGPLVVGNPSADLDSASNEAVSVGRILGVKPLVGAEATVAAVKDAFARSSLVHIAAHAQFDADDPLESSIRLADGELKARRLLGEWNTSDLVVLSACESGADRPILGGELVGFATALLRSGVQTVVASLWPVDDAATRTLMTRFHQALVQKIPVPKALMNAMSYVRSQPGWDLPYYWAPFIVLTQRVE
jgi:CHAT domain-containing protein